MRSLVALATIGVGLVVALASGYIHRHRHGDRPRLVRSAPRRLRDLLVLDIGLFLLAFRILTKREVTFDISAACLRAGRSSSSS